MLVFMLNLLVVIVGYVSSQINDRVGVELNKDVTQHQVQMCITIRPIWKIPLAPMGVLAPRSDMIVRGVGGSPNDFFGWNPSIFV